MIQIRPAEARGHADHGWLRTWHSFSFAEYHDPEQMGWGALRVINDDFIAPAAGFGMHGHRDMEIVTYLLAGSLQHADSMGNGAEIRRPEVQRMSAGSGVRHSEMNPSARDETHLLQIWIEPALRGGAPEYEQRVFDDAAKRGRLLALASPDGADGSLVIRQDARIYATLLAAGESVAHVLAAGRRAYVHVAGGTVTLNGMSLSTGDGAKIAAEPELTLVAQGDAEVLLFDLN